jgi:hypothetical protein
MQRLTIPALAFSALALAACEEATRTPEAAAPSASVTVEAVRTFRVTTTADGDDADSGDGLCRTRSGGLHHHG